MRGAWVEAAACLNDPHPEAWFPDGSDYAARERALRICFACPVHSECLEDVLELERATLEPHGIRGRMTQADRARLIGAA